MIPTDKYLEKCFIIFKRFLKENGRYSFIMSHIFPNGKTKKKFFKDVRELYTLRSHYGFGNILHMRRTLGDYDREPYSEKNSDDYWEDNIRKLSNKWQDYFEKNAPSVENNDFENEEGDLPW